jgi:S-adenosyl-L-methionine hydrolase (adenosine-forming)
MSTTTDRRPYGWISFTTDYGLDDGFVAQCHGVIARIAPAVRVIDVTHAVPPGDVTRGAAVLAQTVRSLPPAVHVAVVDPGVGTARRAVAVRTPGGLLVGPDNGLLPWAADALGGAEAAVELRDSPLAPAPASRTFHGRDLFCPVAAYLAGGADLAAAGPAVAVDGLVRLPDPVVTRGADWLESEVLTVDRFGNVQLAARADAATVLGAALRVGGVEAVRGGTFGDAPSNGLVVFVDSAGHVAVAANGGSAARLLSLTPGDVLRIDTVRAH